MIGIIVVTHLEIATRMIEAAERMFGKQDKLLGLDLKSDDSLQSMTQKIAGAVTDCIHNDECRDGILILTDLFGSTPTNASLAQIAATRRPIEVLTGVNLPMLASAINNRSRLTLAELSAKALYDGQKGIRDAKSILMSRVVAQKS